MRFVIFSLTIFTLCLGGHAQVIQQSFNGTVYTSSGGPGVFSTPSGTQVFGTFTIDTSTIGPPIFSGSVSNIWEQTVLGGLKPGGIPANNNDSVTVASSYGSFTATNLQSLFLATSSYDVEFGGGPGAQVPSASIGISSYAGDAPLPITLSGAFPFKLDGGYTGLVILRDNASGNFIEVNLTSLSGQGCAVNLLPKTFSVATSAISRPYTMAQFVAPDPKTVQLFAASCGFTSLGWQQIITEHPVYQYPAFRIPKANSANVYPGDCSESDPYTGIPPIDSTSDWLRRGCHIVAPPLYYDPPPGDYTYSPADSPLYNSYPFFYPLTFPPNTCSVESADGCPRLPPILSADLKKLTFVDAPANPMSSGSNPPVEPWLAFTTRLVGVSSISLPGSFTCTPLEVPFQGSTKYCTKLFEFKWVSSVKITKSGTYGLDFVQETARGLLDPDGISGEAVITNLNGKDLPPYVSFTQVSVTATGLVYSRVSQTFTGTVTLKNLTSTTINGPLQILMMGLTNGATMVNATGNLSGTPYITLPAQAGLAPGAHQTISVQFKNAFSNTIEFSPTIYSGSLN